MDLHHQDPDSDLWLPVPPDPTQIDPHTVHTHYFGFSVAAAHLGVHLYIRYQPAFGLSQGGVCIFRGTDNVEILDPDYLNWQLTMRWPHVDGNKIVTPYGLEVEFVELGKLVRLRYDSSEVSFDVMQTAVTPLVARAHVMPSEAVDTDPANLPGGSEQFMHCTGFLALRGERHEVDCLAPRDRSWNQVRSERRGAVDMPPIAWTPICFGPDLAFNQMGFEAPDTNPPYRDVYPVDDGRPSHVYGWVHTEGQTASITKVKREVHQRNPYTHVASHQSIQATDALGRSFEFRGVAVAATTLPAWPNLAFHDSLYRWETTDGRITHSTCQEAWYDKYQHHMNRVQPRPLASV
ncbi:hypothetical protein MycrhDRAFT_2035 [Mycolicibacterium rhodesiae JS60]|nr:hypothetical protein MycrhDRAFT_2035 [Mycolicibacterium rhodesiae JS60]